MAFNLINIHIKVFGFKKIQWNLFQALNFFIKKVFGISLLSSFKQYIAKECKDITALKTLYQLIFHKFLFLLMQKEKQVSNILSHIINIRLNLAKIWKEQAVTSLTVNLLVWGDSFFTFFFFHIIFLVKKILPPICPGLISITAGCGSFWECLGTSFCRTSLQRNHVSVKARCMQVHREKSVYPCVCLITHNWHSVSLSD